MKSRNWLLMLGLVALALLATGCAKSFEGSFLQKAEDRGWSEEEALAALFSQYSYGELLFKEGEEGLLPKVDYSKIPVDWVETYTSAVLGDLDWLLTCKPESNKTCRNWYSLINSIPGFVDSLQAEWIENRWVHARVRRVKLYNEFQTMLSGKKENSTTPAYIPEYYGYEKTYDPIPSQGEGGSTSGVASSSSKTAESEAAYDIRIIYPLYDLESEYAFTADYVEDAKASGNLRLTDTFVVLDYAEFDTMDEEGNWQSRVEGLHIYSYMVLDPKATPKDSKANYIEVFRAEFQVGEDGRYELLAEESLPAIRGFMSAESKKVDLFVVDIDKEGQQGWGVPDIIENILGINTGRDLYLKKRAKLRELIFEKAREEAERHEVYVPEHSKDLQIVYKGDVDFDIWEACPEEGCKVPYDYSEHDWRAKIAFTSETKDEDIKQIEYLIKRYKSARRVTEYYKPLAEYAQKNILDASATGHVWRIWRQGKPVVEGGLDIFAEAYPYMIEYTDPNDNSLYWQLIDEDGDGKTDKKRPIAK